MGTEIERKFLLRGDGWRAFGQGVVYRQGYLTSPEGRVVRVRTVGEAKGYLTIKGRTDGLARREYEYEIPYADAREMLEMLAQKPLIEKRRLKIPFAGHVWEVDEFFGDNAGLVVAEIELSREDEPFEKPAWVGEEVTDDPRYLNSNLVRHPYVGWGKSSQ